ncbi:MAG: hypothetical protein JSV04_14125 [Candidatus Heimdallarchaeota archaeon]|nr:MAG: hypothetical protein JSV04_14125 [Candidatus Heimdallarchaeota archaeon]
MSETSHSEAIAGVRIKRFLTMAVMRLSTELIDRDDTKETKKIIENMIIDLVKSNFTLSSSDNRLTQAKLFLASLGFSPCEIEWSDDVRLGKVLLGKGRIWKATTPKDTELTKLLLSAVVKGLGYSFIDSNVQVSFVENGLLPLRFAYELQFRATEDVFAESIQPTKEKSEVLLSAGSLLEPILGRGIRIEDATRYLIEGTQIVVEQFQPELLERKDIEDYPLKLLEVLYLKSQEDERFEEIAHQIGVAMVQGIRQGLPQLENHQILKGIGLIPTEEIDELLFYGDVDICGTGSRGVNISFCRFLGHIWGGFVSEVLEKKFRMTEDPLCATSTGTKCIFTIEEVPT